MLVTIYMLKFIGGIRLETLLAMAAVPVVAATSFAWGRGGCGC